jgi:hypothetical protein
VEQTKAQRWNGQPQNVYAGAPIPFFNAHLPEPRRSTRYRPQPPVTDARIARERAPRETGIYSAPSPTIMRGSCG